MRTLLLFLLCFGVLLFVPVAYAQQITPFDLSISPAVVEIAVKPGKLVTQAFSVENAGSVDLEVRPVLREFRSDDQTGSPILEDTNSFPYASLQNANQALDTPFTLRSNSSEQLVLALNIPEDAQERDWYIALLLQTRPSKSTPVIGSGSQITGQIAANVLVRVTNTNQVPHQWAVTLKGVPKFIDSLQSITVTPIVSNTSKSMAVPELHLVVLDSKKAIVHEQDGLPDRVLAQSSREIFAAKQRKDDPRSYEPTSFTFDPLFAVGPYTVRATIRNGADGPVVTEQSYIAFPFSLCIAGTSLGGLVWLSRKLRRKR